MPESEHPLAITVSMEEARRLAADQATSTPSREGEEATESERESEREGQDVDESVEARSGGPFGGLTAREARLRGAAKARERRKQAEEDAQNSSMSARIRFGVALSKIPQSELDEVVQVMVREAKAGKTQAIAALARMADQAWGKAQPDVEPPPDPEGDARSLTREERSELIAMMQERRRLQEQASGEPSDPRGSAADGGGAPPP